MTPCRKFLSSLSLHLKSLKKTGRTTAA